MQTKVTSTHNYIRVIQLNNAIERALTLMALQKEGHPACSKPALMIPKRSFMGIRSNLQ